MSKVRLAWVAFLSAVFLCGEGMAAKWPAVGAGLRRVGGGEKDVALIAGVTNYPNVAPIPGAVQNAKAWYSYLTEARGVPADRVRLLLDKGAVREKLVKFTKELSGLAEPGGVFWFVFIGHGAPSKKGDALLVGSDVDQDADSLEARSIRRSDVLAMLGNAKARLRVMVVDACFSGKTTGGKPLVAGLQPLVVTAPETAAGPATVVLTAAKGDEYAGSLPGLARPAFSYLVLGGLRGWADTDKDSKVTAGELVSYATRSLRALVTDRTQTPTLAGESGEVVGAAFDNAAPPVAKLAVSFVSVGARELVQAQSHKRHMLFEAGFSGLVGVVSPHFGGVFGIGYGVLDHLDLFVHFLGAGGSALGTALSGGFTMRVPFTLRIFKPFVQAQAFGGNATGTPPGPFLHLSGGIGAQIDLWRYVGIIAEVNFGMSQVFGERESPRDFVFRFGLGVQARY